MTSRNRLLAQLALGVLAAAALAAGLLAWRQHPRRYLRQAEEALAARDYDRARDQLDRYLRHRPGDARALLLAARAARNCRSYFEAYELLRRCRDAGGDAEAVAVEWDLIAVERGEEPAPALRQRAEQADEVGLAALEVLIQSDIDAYRLNQALGGLTRYLQARPDDLHARLARSYVWERFLYFSDALDDYKEAVAAHPESEPARLKLAETLLLVGTPNEALSQYEWLAERQPNRRAVRLGLARCHRRLGDAERARKLLGELLAAAPEDGEVLWERGQLEMDQGQPAAAEKWLRQAVAASPHDRRTWYSLGRCLLALGRNEEAEEANARVAQIDADLRRLDRVRQAVMRSPNDAALRCEGGLLFLKRGERQEGLKWLRQALRLDPDCRAARDALGAAEGGRP